MVWRLTRQPPSRRARAVAAFDVQSQRVDLFGQGGGYASRAFLLYDGIHYDLMVRALFDGASEELDVSVFATTDEAAMAEARALVAAEHKARKFTDTAGFTLRCLVCQCGLVGEAGALEHAKKTGHQNFAEYH
jgi:ubiquitin thioesterase OTU1